MKMTLRFFGFEFQVEGSGLNKGRFRCGDYSAIFAASRVLVLSRRRMAAGCCTAVISCKEKHENHKTCDASDGDCDGSGGSDGGNGELMKVIASAIRLTRVTKTWAEATAWQTTPE